MAQSQRDMFLSSPEPSPRRWSSSLPEPPSYQYLWCILFVWDPDVEYPFSYYQLGMFPKQEMKPVWISGDLDSDSRKKKLKFSYFPGKKFSLFGKVEKCKWYYIDYICIINFGNDRGTIFKLLFYIYILISDVDCKRRETILNDLNESFNGFLENFTISDAYAQLVERKPYKILSCFSYDWKFTPLKRRELNLHEKLSPKPRQVLKLIKKEKRKEKGTESGCTEEDNKEFVFPSHRYLFRQKH